MISSFVNSIEGELRKRKILQIPEYRHESLLSPFLDDETWYRFLDFTPRAFVPRADDENYRNNAAV